MAKRRIIMIYPKQGVSGIYVRHAPLGLLYASAEIVKHGYDVHIVDTRVDDDWRRRVRDLLDGRPLAVGISVMSGTPIKNAIVIGRYIKSIARDVPVVWGGPHATFKPESILRDEWSADYVVSGYGAEPFRMLCDALAEGRVPDQVPGVSWREGGTVRLNPPADSKFEFIDWRDIPYHLIADYGPYGQLEDDRRIFSMYSALGCPYQCTFCSSPAQYANIAGKKWQRLEPIDVVDHIQFLVERYRANYIYFIDDDSFPSLRHVEDIIDEITRRGLHVKLGFRGARVNEIKKMSDEFLSKLAASGTDIMHIGAESGSDRILKLIKKNCTAKDIVDINRKLARHPEIRVGYNFMMGVPTETIEDLRRTRDLMLQLVADHPNCLIFQPNKFRPLPGTELYVVAKNEWGYEMPETLGSWANIEAEGDISDQWYDADIRRFCNLLLITSYFVDNKIMRVTKGRSLFYKAMRLANLIYRPIALLRLRTGFDRALVEYRIYRLLGNLLARPMPAD
jgi:radical SAM superfamily enzyme YgiQ (UPF0313 family)